MSERYSEQWIGLRTLQASRTAGYRADEWRRIELVAALRPVKGRHGT